MSTVALRAREYRQRKRAGRIVIEVEVGEVDLIEALVRRNFLQASDAEDREKISRALQSVVDLWIAVERAEDIEK